MKLELTSGPALVVRLKNEADVTLEIVERQSRFAQALREGNILTPAQYRSSGAFARRYEICGSEVIVTVEQFAENEIKLVDAETAKATGILLAKMHSVSEKQDLHVCNPVLFDPFSRNDLFDYNSFQALEREIDKARFPLFQRITEKYHSYMDILAPLKSQPRFAVQGDISNCNLYRDSSGEIGVFDFNRCGDNNLFCDAVMQAVFEARLMDYSDDIGDSLRPEILDSFWQGYRSIRDFSEEQKIYYFYLHEVIQAFWSSDIRWNEDSLINVVKNQDKDGTQRWLEVIWQRLTIFE